MKNASYFVFLSIISAFYALHISIFYVDGQQTLYSLKIIGTDYYISPVQNVP